MSTPWDTSTAPWQVARDQERTARQRRLDEAKQAEIELAAGPFCRIMQEEFDAVISDDAQDLASLPGPGPGAISLEGPEMIAYVRVKAASKAALELQQAYAAAGAELRAAIEAMCQLMAPPVK